MVVKHIVIIFLILFSGCSNPSPERDAIPRGATVLILGDSLSYGTGADKGQDYPSLLAKATGWNIINAGVPGDTSEQGLERLTGLLEAHHPSLLVVELGGNDLLRKMQPMTIEHHIKAILAEAKTRGVATVLVAIPAADPLMAAVGNLSDHPVYEKIAQDTKTPLIKEVFSDVLSDRSLKFDQIHPNADGYAKVAEEMQANLKALGFIK